MVEELPDVLSLPAEPLLLGVVALGEVGELAELPLAPLEAELLK